MTESKALTAPTPAQLLAIAVEQNADLDKLEKLMALQERWEANEARKAFVKAKAEFKKSPPKLPKSKHVNYTKKDGSVTDYWHADLSSLVERLTPALSAVGLTFSWETGQEQSGLIKVACVLEHEMGHAERVSLHGAPDQSGGKNAIQAIGSTTTYLQRYTLLAALGLATEEQDDDGAGGQEVELVSPEQIAEIQRLVRETKSDSAAMLRWLKVENIGDIQAVRYEEVIRNLKAKQKKGTNNV